MLKIILGTGVAQLCYQVAMTKWEETVSELSNSKGLRSENRSVPLQTSPAVLVLPPRGCYRISATTVNLG